MAAQRARYLQIDCVVTIVTSVVDPVAPRADTPSAGEAILRACETLHAKRTASRTARAASPHTGFMQTPRQVVWIVTKGGKRRAGCLRTVAGAVEFQVVEGDNMVLISSRYPSREPALVLAEELRQAYFADGWSEEF